VKAVRVIPRDCFEIPSASRPRTSEYQQSVRLRSALALLLVHVHSRSDLPTESAAAHSGDGLAQR
jgi:hypothetical protein